MKRFEAMSRERANDAVPGATDVDCLLFVADDRGASSCSEVAPDAAAKCPDQRLHGLFDFATGFGGRNQRLIANRGPYSRVSLKTSGKGQPSGMPSHKRSMWRRLGESAL